MSLKLNSINVPAARGTVSDIGKTTPTIYAGVGQFLNHVCGQIIQFTSKINRDLNQKRHATKGVKNFIERQSHSSLPPLNILQI
ncbi:hypothetical protein DSM106972_088140 [Dulcicalothrix desertica PCC 7102]|uniref:Uncharacterized protein n=1 Tax=Dulcicalothrix desertica PCC 7102 TaxID=232991 RepID=A0A3S1CPX7_9CYAN|nr:hypothetical protein DSM106972_088140 [Dulcicalothrix desertica PCC 7102]TWH40403.1 hypothetical protein CAL7102_09728 [Dulcicalothrix desertica PCC 7102]